MKKWLCILALTVASTTLFGCSRNIGESTMTESVEPEQSDTAHTDESVEPEQSDTTHTDKSLTESVETEKTDAKYTTDSWLDTERKSKPLKESFDKIEYSLDYRMTMKEVIDIVGFPHETGISGYGFRYLWETKSGETMCIHFGTSEGFDYANLTYEDWTNKLAVVSVSDWTEYFDITAS